MTTEVKVDGVWLRSLGHVSAIKWSTRWGTGPCGPDLASCTLAVSPNTDTSVLRPGRPFQVWADGVLVFGGVTSSPQKGFPWTLNARGWPRRAGDFEAVDGSGNPTTNPRTAATSAIANGAPFTGASVFTNSSLGTDGGPDSQMLDEVLDASAITEGKRWGSDAYGALFLTADPTTPTWYLDASDLDIGVADDGLFTRVRARYVTSVDVDGNPDGWASEAADDAAAQGLYNVIEYPMKLADLGLLSSGTAAAYAASQLALLTVPQWLSRVTTNSSRLRTKGGLGAHLPSVRAGQMVHLFNVPRSLGGIQSELGLNVVLGEVEYDTENPTQITLAPVNLAVRNLADLATQAAQNARRAA